MGRHDGQVAVVTGAASGIGRASVETIVAAGGRAVALDVDESSLAWAAGEDRIAVLAGDVTEPRDNEAAVALAESRFGHCDVAVLNAGIPMSGDIVELPMEDFDRVIEVNVRGVVLGIRAAVPAMRRAGGGSIVATASTSGIGGDPNMWPYNTSKAAVVNLVRAVAIDLAAEGIRVNAVCPGPTETAMTAARAGTEWKAAITRHVPMQRWGRAEEQAAAVSFLASPAASFVTGVALPVDGGVTASTSQFLPREAP